jgi:hypothetical protein
LQNILDTTFEHRRSHSVSHVRHRAEPASPDQWWWNRHHHVVRRDREPYDWSTIVGTWRPRRLELHVDGFSRASSTAAATSTSALFGIYRWGWGFSTSQDFNGDLALIACFASSWTPAMVRRWHADPFGFLRPWNEMPALMGSAPPAMPPATGTGVITFLMG